jgi:hypothetical protein
VQEMRGGCRQAPRSLPPALRRSHARSPWRGAVLVAFALLLAHAHPGLADPPKDKRRAPGAVPNEAYPLELRKQVVEGLTKASEHLFGLQEKDGSWPGSHHASRAEWPGGPTALALHALLEAGAKPLDPRIERGFVYLRSVPHDKTYQAAATLLALWARHAERHADYREILEPDGGDDPQARAALRKPEHRADFALAKVCFETLLEAQHENGAFGYGGPTRWDTSNMQYGLLGLRAAREFGFKVKTDVWVSAMRFLIEWQEPDGPETALKTTVVEGDYRLAFSEKARARGFGYFPSTPTNPQRPYATTTAGCVASLLLLQDELDSSLRFRTKDRERTRAAIRDGLAWLQNWLRDHTSGHYNGGATWFDYLFLYELERIGVLGHVRFIGSHDWYLVGARELVESQRADGGWGPNIVLDTAWAVLFLKRASFRARRGAITPSEPNRSAPGGGAPPDACGEATAELAKAEALHRGGISASEDGFEKESADLVREGLRLLTQARDLLAPLSENERLPAADRDLALELLADAEGRIDEAEDWLAGPRAPAPEPIPVPPDVSPSPLAEPSLPEQVPSPPPPSPLAGPPGLGGPSVEVPSKESFTTLTGWCRAVGRLRDAAASATVRAILARRVAEEAGVIGLPMLLAWFETEADPGARAAVHEGLAHIGTAQVASAMVASARRDRATRWDDAVDVICRCLEMPDDDEPERPFVRAIRRFHRLKEPRLTTQIQNRLFAMGREGVAALGQVLYVADFGHHDLTIAQLSVQKDRRAVPPLVYKMNRFLFAYRVQLPAHQALLRMGWHAVPELINRLDDGAAGTWISWTLRKITTETMGTDKRKWSEWWKRERVRHPEVVLQEDRPGRSTPR